MWNDKDDAELDECLAKVRAKILELKTLERPLVTLEINITQIQTRKSDSLNDKRERTVIKTKPLDKWRKEMSNAERMKTKDQCITETHKLLEDISE